MKLSYRIYFFILFPILMLPLILVNKPHNYINGTEMNSTLIKEKNKPYLCVYMLVIMAAFWALDILPYGMTSIIPILFAPLMDIEASNSISKMYSGDPLMLCLGRLILACAYQRHQIHRRFGLYLLLKFGPQPRQIIMGCMIPSYILTMFISNTATAPIMLEFAIEILNEIKKIEKNLHTSSYVSINLPNIEDDERLPIVNQKYSPDHLAFLEQSNLNDQFPSMTSVIARNTKINDEALGMSLVSKEHELSDQMKCFSQALFLSTGWAASSGSLATIVASGPNLVFYGIVQGNLDYGVNLNYLTFLIIGLPLSFVILILVWLWVGIFNLGPREFLTCRKNTLNEELLKKRFQELKDDLGPITFPELSCLFLTALVIILWITRQLPNSKGWGYSFTNDGILRVSDATPMMLVIILIYIWPSKWRFWRAHEKSDPGAERLLTWDFTHKSLPWSIIFLLGAGFAMGEVCDKSGLTKAIGEFIGTLDINPPVMMIIASVLACISTEFLSSTSLLPIYLVIFIKVACHMKKHPFYFLLPLTFSSSMAFCLPSATTPNIAIFNRGLSTTFQMTRTGIFMDIIFIGVVIGFTYSFGEFAFQLHTFPPWFNQSCAKSRQ